MAKHYEFNEDDLIFTIFTDSVEMYNSRLQEMNSDLGKYTQQQAEVDYNSVIKKQGAENFAELSFVDKKRIHNLKYFTWVEQQGKNVEELNAQWDDSNYWNERFSVVTEWDNLIDNFNREVGIEVK